MMLKHSTCSKFMCKDKRFVFDVEDRVSAAKSLIAKLKRSRCSKIIEETSRLCVAYVELANHNMDKFKGKNGGKLPVI